MYTSFTSAKLEQSKSVPGGESRPTRTPLNRFVKRLFWIKLYFRNSVTSDCADCVGGAEVHNPNPNPNPNPNANPHAHSI